MIIGAAFKRLFTGLTVDLVVEGVVSNALPVKFHYGDQHELIKRTLSEKDNVKYPLVWYVIAPYKELDGTYRAESQLIILQNTEAKYFNDFRHINKYEAIIEPVWKVVKRKIEQNPFVSAIGDSLLDQYKYIDEPSYGVPNKGGMQSKDFQSKVKSGTKGIASDIVDAKIINFTFRIEPGCIK